MFETLVVQCYWFHSAAALKGNLQWWGKTVTAKSSLAFIRRVSEGNQLVRVYWNLMNNWCRLIRRTTGKFVLVLPVGQSLTKQLKITAQVFSINNPNFLTTLVLIHSVQYNTRSAPTFSKVYNIKGLALLLCAHYMYDLFHTNAHNKSTVHSLDESYGWAGEQSSTSPQILSTLWEMVLLYVVVLKRFPIQRKPRAKTQFNTQESAFHKNLKTGACSCVCMFFIFIFYLFSLKMWSSCKKAELIFI